MLSSPIPALMCPLPLLALSGAGHVWGCLERLLLCFACSCGWAGIGRLTANFLNGRPCIDEAIRGTDREAVEMTYYLLRNGVCGGGGGGG